ncbi:MAG TPA: hypothetical protein VKU84_08580 [Stellaceae bacterium]|nr:hypothetical protein [Stellaceae bacterium]
MTPTGAVSTDTGRPTALAGPLWLGAAAYALLLIVGERLLNDPDTYWHIATGRWIWAHRAVPAVDPFSHTLVGAPWHAHEWLAELAIAGAYGGLGWTGVVALAALCVAASLALLMRALERFARPTVALGATALSFFLMAAHLTARPHALALPILVAWAAALVRARSESRTPSLRVLPLMVLWANLHGGFVVGLGLAGALAVEAVLTAENGDARRVAIVGWGRFVAGAALASLLTPDGFAGWWFPFKLMSLGFALNFVGEWHAPALGLTEPLVLWLAALIGFALATGLRAPLFRALMVAGLVAMALSHTRNAELLAILAPLLLAPSIPIPLRPWGRRGIAMSGAVLALLIAATAGAAVHGYAHENPDIAPAPALATAKQAGLTGPVFNDYDFGGYLIFEGVPVFVDGRIDLYGDDFMRAYAAALDNEDDALPHLLERYQVTWTLLKPDEAAVAALDRDPAWERVYADASAVVHRRR